MAVRPSSARGVQRYRITPRRPTNAEAEALVSAQQGQLRAESPSHIVSTMEARAFQVDSLSADERIELMGRLWDCLDPAAAPMSAELGAELDHREADADAAPDAGDSWAETHLSLARKLR